MDHVRTCCGLPQWDVARRAHDAGEIRRTRKAQPRDRGDINPADRARLWRDAVDPAGTIVETYLEGRGLFLPADFAGRVIRFHKHCPFQGDHFSRVHHPAMLCRYSPIVHDYEPEAEPTAIYRTALKADGSGYVTKQMLGRVLGPVRQALATTRT